LDFPDLCMDGVFGEIDLDCCGVASAVLTISTGDC
jgi:hypothetical protein